MRSDFESLASRLTAEGKIATPVLKRILAVVDNEIEGMVRQRINVPLALRHLRDVVARACLVRLEEERGASSPESDDDLSAR